MAYEIATDNPVLVTGATGFLGGWLVKDLLEAGVEVHAGVRGHHYKSRLKSLQKIAEESAGKLKIFKADLLDKGSYDEAMQGCDVVFHTASPFKLRYSHPEVELIAPALEGTRNVLTSVNKTPTVVRVVLTSSCAAIYGDAADIANAPKGILDETCWNTTSSPTHQPYSYAKTVAEKLAWEMAAAQKHWKLVTINPAFILGPTLSGRSTSGTHEMFLQMGKGDFKNGLPKMEIGTTDVRDVSYAHIAAAYLENAEGRHIISDKVLSFLEIAKVLRTHFGDEWPFPKREIPKTLIWLLGPVLDKLFTRKMIAGNVGHPWQADNSKSIRSLKLKYHPIEPAIIETFQQLIDEKAF